MASAKGLGRIHQQLAVRGGGGGGVGSHKVNWNGGGWEAVGELLRDALEAAAPYDIVGSNDPRDSNDNDGGGTGDEPQLVALLLSCQCTPHRRRRGGGCSASPSSQLNNNGGCGGNN